jgi:antitoxin component YwqK of YwqJK toxin-antitoxin module
MAQPTKRFIFVLYGDSLGAVYLTHNETHDTYKLSRLHPLDNIHVLRFQNANTYGGITNLLSILNDENKEKKVNDIIGDFQWIVCTYQNDGVTGQIVKTIPVLSVNNSGLIKKGYIIDTLYVPGEAARASAAVPEAAQPGGSLYDKSGKLLYRGEMKNGLPHGYGTGYYANGKVGHVGLFKGGKIVQ